MSIIKSSRELIHYIWTGDKTIVRGILALSWFLLVGSVYMAQFANYAQGVVGANSEVYILFLTTFSIGLAIGSVICDTLLRGEISARMSPIAALGISLFTYLMVLNTPTAPHDGLFDVTAFFSIPSHWILLMCMLMVAVCGGIYMVPLYAILQSRATEQYRSRVMAASNFSDSIFMTLAAILSAILLALGVSVLDLFLLLATFNLGAVLYARRLVS